MALGDNGAVGLLEELGRRWYRLCADAVPPPRSRDLDVVAELAHHFVQARRILNLVTDRYLFPLRDRWFGPAMRLSGAPGPPSSRRFQRLRSLAWAWK